MKATQDLLRVWRIFDHHPMETLTKAWYFSQVDQNKQRSVALMREHRHQFGTSGNCFDLAIWLMEELRESGISTYAIGHDLHTPHAHVAVVAINEDGAKYFCDLGDQWIDPILIESDSEDYCEDALDGFVTGGKIRVETSPGTVNFNYIRPNGKVSQQKFDLQPIQREELLRAANYSQSLLRHPLVEMRIHTPEEVTHWEFDNWKSFNSSNHGLVYEADLTNNVDWADRINHRTGIHKDIIMDALELYSRIIHK